MDDSGEKVEMEYRWGPRARIEFPEMNVLQFIEEVMSFSSTDAWQCESVIVST